MAPKLSTSTIGYKSITVRFACGMLHARHNDAPRRGQAGNADRTFDASKQSPSYYSVLLHSFYFLLSSLFNYTVRLMAPGMRVCKKKKITSARLNNYSPSPPPPPATTTLPATASSSCQKKQTSQILTA